MEAALDSFISGSLSMERWPFWAFAVICAIVGQVTSKSVFTRERAYLKALHQPLWWWGRETLPLHPIIAGTLLGLLWKDPEGKAWGSAASCVYFAFAGAVSTVLWIFIKGIAKRRGVELSLPGESVPPPGPK